MKNILRKHYLRYILVCLITISLTVYWLEHRHAHDNTLKNSYSSISSFAQPKPLPSFSFIDSNGKTLTLKDFPNHTILINLWATWCTPCIKEMPDLLKLQQKLKNQNISILFISLDSKPWTHIQTFLDKHQLQLKTYKDNNQSTFEAFNSLGLPTTHIINKQKQWVATINGIIDWNSKEIENTLTSDI